MKNTGTCVLCRGKTFKILFTHHLHWKMGKCASCGLVQVVPMPEKEQVDALYEEDLEHFTPYIDQIVVHHRYFRQKISEIAHTMGLSNLFGIRFLDIGCAMGVLLEEAKQKGMKVVGVDISNDAVSYCRSRRLKAYNGTIMSLRKTIRPRSFDVVTAFQVIEHERDPLNMMKRIQLILKKNGVVVLATPNYGGWWRRIMGRRWFGFAHPEHLVLFDSITMKLLLENSGFRDIQIRADDPRPFPLSFAVTRAADYFPWAKWLLLPIGRFLDRFEIKNPINPWDDMIAIARK
jgi:2-polyprenyl-3-methyl-5-hydroxy-6-metoxy-1,4-benzoquinol methylase